ncbi:hypothetical protein HPB50_024942 [Hyalomma asiaticum]|uniref:Uncharacterized protein n=1 Tax=Hyalomma asiaticum TaxID=266040 RepID=A0ACB7TNK8_HYAAI|nr:hypothetical protein HPB50_024942 [Hyalomma asiaticum]
MWGRVEVRKGIHARSRRRLLDEKRIGPDETAIPGKGAPISRLTRRPGEIRAGVRPPQLLRRLRLRRRLLPGGSCVGPLFVPHKVALTLARHAQARGSRRTWVWPNDAPATMRVLLQPGT